MPQGEAKVQAAAAKTGLNAINVCLGTDGDLLEANFFALGAPKVGSKRLQKRGSSLLGTGRQYGQEIDIAVWQTKPIPKAPEPVQLRCAQIRANFR